MRGEYQLQSDKSWTATMEELQAEMRRWEVQSWETQPDHVPYRDQSMVLPGSDAAVSISWVHADGRRGAMTIDSWNTLRENFRVAYLNLRDMRMIERRGGEKAVAAAYQMLGAGEVVAARDPHEVLEVRPGASMDVIDGAYKALSKSRHPDKGGSDAAFKELQIAYDTLKKEAS